MGTNQVSEVTKKSASRGEGDVSGKEKKKKKKKRGGPVEAIQVLN